MSAPTITRSVHLVELSLLAEHRYSATLGYLHAAIAADPVAGPAVHVSKHIVDSRPGRLEVAAQALVEAMDEPAVVAFTIYFWNRPQTLAVAAMVKRRWPHTLIVVGGNDVTNQQEVLFHEAPWLDLLVHGEGELRFATLCRNIVEGRAAEDGVEGISRNGPDGIQTSPPAARIVDLETVPSPLLSDVYSDEDLAATRLIIYETNRGCPYTCSFCYWGGATKSKVRQFSLERVQAELERIVRVARPGSSIFVADANFGILGRDLDIAHTFAQLCERYGKRLTFMTNWAKNSNSKVVEIASVLHSKGLAGAVTLSAQSFDEKTLQIANRSNIKADRYRLLQQEFRARGIPTYTDLIWGLPGEPLTRHLDGVEHVLAAGGCPVVYPLLLLNNTEYASDTFAKERPLTVRRLPCDVSNPDLVADVVVAHEDMTEADWVRGMQHVSAVGLFAKAAMRCTIRYLATIADIRIVDMVSVLMDRIADGSLGHPQLTAVQTNYGDCLLHPEAIDEQLLTSVLDDATMREDRHYQAMMHLVLDDAATHRRVITAAAASLVEHFELSATPGVQFLPGVIGLDAVGGSVWRSAVKHTRLSGTFAVDPAVLDVLVAAGEVPDWGHDPFAPVVHGRARAKAERAEYSLSVYSLALLKGARRLLWDADTTLLGGAAPLPVPLAG